MNTNTNKTEMARQIMNVWQSDCYMFFRSIFFFFFVCVCTCVCVYVLRVRFL